MDGHALHLMVNHFPIILALLGAAAAVLAFITRKRAVLLYTVATLTLAGASSYPALWSGEEAEEAIEERWYVNRDQIHEHEESAEVAKWILLATGVVSAAGWWRLARAGRDAQPGMALLSAVLVLSVASATAMAWTSWQGGFIAIKNPTLVTSPAPAGRVAAPTDGVNGAVMDSAMTMDSSMDHAKH